MRGLSGQQYEPTRRQLRSAYAKTDISLVEETYDVDGLDVTQIKLTVGKNWFNLEPEAAAWIMEDLLARYGRPGTASGRWPK
jgi:hypothetical protein